MKQVTVKHFEPGELTGLEQTLYETIWKAVTDAGYDLSRTGAPDEVVIKATTRVLGQIAANAYALADHIGIDV